ncbi:dihydrodipicolinate synthase family protein, partial [Halobacterium bonnevillei]|uniref:dihydrodipicolinate synthase family protein n=1 Tax=Halobacterium bonnevillei TaxID=2692200 RepID=UPI001F318422
TLRAGAGRGRRRRRPRARERRPERASDIRDLHAAGKDEAARAVNRRVLELNDAVTAQYGVPGLKAAMRSRDMPAGTVRSPHRPVDDDVATELASLVEDALP